LAGQNDFTEGRIRHAESVSGDARAERHALYAARTPARVGRTIHQAPGNDEIGLTGKDGRPSEE
jgi:hypothetical protein